MYLKTKYKSKEMKIIVKNGMKITLSRNCQVT